MGRRRKASERVTELEGLKWEPLSKSIMLESSIKNLDSHNEMLAEYVDHLWMEAVDMVTIYPDD